MGEGEREHIVIKKLSRGEGRRMKKREGEREHIVIKKLSRGEGRRLKKGEGERELSNFLQNI